MKQISQQPMLRLNYFWKILWLISEHLNIQKELDCQLHKIASAEEKLQVLKDYEVPTGE